MDKVKSVLIIDDDEDDFFLIEDRLSAMVSDDCSFVLCSKKREAIDLLKERTFDLCILDHRLAGYDGLEILDAVANAELATPIIMLTGQNDEEIAKKAIKSGAQDFVTKASIDEDIFEKSVRYAIARKELEFARVLRKRSESENIAKDKFIAHLSHELRTPLTSILGYTSLLLENDKTITFQQELKVISNNGKHLLNLLNDVLDLSKIAAGKFELKNIPTDLQQSLVEVNSLLTVSAVDKGLYLNFTCETPLPLTVNLDDVRFKQVMVNLIGNAIKFTDIGGINITISLVKENGSNVLEFLIKDSGIGMPEHQIKNIFIPFKQIEDVSNRKAGGAGLGLSITAEIVKQMRGTLAVASDLGVGSTFSLRLPCDAITDAVIEYDFNTEYAAETRVGIPSLKGKVLIVDDVFEIRQLVGHFVRETGLDVEFASNGQQALAKMAMADTSDKSIDVILMDLHMPILTGQETVAILREQGITAPVVAMTAAINKGLYHELTKMGFDQLISKPIDKSELWKILEGALQKKPSEKDLIKLDDKYPLVHLVEDDIDSATIMQMMLEQLHFRVIRSSTAQEAIDTSMNSSTIAIHLVDLGLPDMQGEEFIDAFFLNDISGTVSILSGHQPDATLLKKYPIVDHLIKPISKDALSKWLHKQR